MQDREQPLLLSPRDGARGSCNWAGTSSLAEGTIALRHEDAFPPTTLSNRFRSGKPTFARTRGNEQDAPKPVVAD